MQSTLLPLKFFLPIFLLSSYLLCINWMISKVPNVRKCMCSQVNVQVQVCMVLHSLINWHIITIWPLLHPLEIGLCFLQVTVSVALETASEPAKSTRGRGHLRIYPHHFSFLFPTSLLTRSVVALRIPHRAPWFCFQILVRLFCTLAELVHHLCCRGSSHSSENRYPI